MTNNEKILLALLPFWTPLIPPMGIACLKSFLRQHDYTVVTVDANTEKQFKDLYNHYFDTLKEMIPKDKRGNFYSIGQDVFHNHLMAHLNYKRESQYIQLVKILLEKTFYTSEKDEYVLRLNRIIASFYSSLRGYVLDLLERHRPMVLGLSVCSGTLPASLFAFRLTREKYPHIKTIMGGGIFCDQLAMGTPNFEILLEKTRDYIDKFIVGEGEIILLKLLRGELPESQRVYWFGDIKGGNLDLSSVDIPDFSDFELHHYPYLSAYTSRSCPHQCNFCSDTVMWGKYRKKTPPQIVDELSRLYQKHKYQLVMMSDLLLNPIVTDLAKEFIKTGISIYWDGCLRAEKPACDRENTMLWRKGGFYKARIGCESGSEKVLKNMNKNISLEQMKAAISSLAYAGIQTTTYWVIGYPGESEEEFQQTLDLITELRDDIYEAECRPFYYYLTGQANSMDWAKKNKSIPLYPGSAEEMLLFQTWVLDGKPSREETYKRVHRFEEHCKSLGIPNPYTMADIFAADQRWKKLHQNAVPSLFKFRDNSTYIDECKHIKELSIISDIPKDDGDFDF
ncbi:MAG: radical SAM protein [Candidatus Aminicenantes bacterium]|nr:MAG: radical SAM protein [Candidatus Aminicenantes bacterium]